MLPRQVPLSRNDLLWALGSLCQLHRVPFDPGLILRQYAPPYSLETLVHAVQSLKFKATLEAVPPAAVARFTLPLVALLKPRSTGAELASTLALVLRSDAGQLLLIESGAEHHAVVSAENFAARYGGTVLLATPEADADQEKMDALRGAPFGFRWFMPELLKHRRIWGEVIGASFIIQVMALGVPIFTQVIIDKVIAHQTFNTLLVIAIGLAVFLVFGAVLTWVRQYLVLHTGNRVDAVLATSVFEHLFRLPMRYFEHRPSGTLVARLQAVESIREFVSGAAVTIFLDLPFLALFLAVMFYYSWTLTLVTLAILAALVALSLAVTPPLRSRINQQFLLGARNQAFITEYVAGMETVKSLQMEPQLSARYGDYLAGFLGASFSTRQLANTFGVAANTLEQAMTYCILCLGAWIAMTTNHFTIGMLVAFQMFAGRLSGPMLRLVGLWQEMQQAAIAVKRLGDIMDAPREPYALVPARDAKAKGKIEIQGLGFRYEENLPWLFRDFALAVEPGRSMAVMGPSGCGKSTLAKLLQGFYPPQEGRILLNGLDIRHLAANELRRLYGVVPQETVLFSGTIYENLVLANPHASFEQVVEACKFAEIHDVVEALPQGYQTPVGEHGSGLSGGQKQRIAIARALLKRPRILIFDEATSSLDPRTAEQFARTINRLRGKVTLFFIAHQLPKGLAVDAVVTLGGGGDKHLSVAGRERVDG